MRESTCRELVKDEGFGSEAEKRKTKRPGDHMIPSDEEPAANAGQPCAKGQTCGSVLVLETVYDRYRFVRSSISVAVSMP